MPLISEKLEFKTENRSQWGPGEAQSLYFGTGNSFIYEPARQSRSIDFGAWGNDFSLGAYADFKIGFEAYATLGTNSGFDAQYHYETTVDYVSGIDLSSGVASGDFSLTDERFVFGNLSTQTSEVTPAARLDFVIGAGAGLTASWSTWLDDGSDSFSIFNIPEARYKLAGVDAQLDTFEVQLGEDSGVVFKLPELPATSTQTGFVSDQVLVASGSTIKDPFLKANIDFDEAIGELIGLIPGAGRA